VRVWYEVDNYPSHARAGGDYQHAIGQFCDWAPSIESADVVILHIEPVDLSQVYEERPFLRNKYVISVCVWEASEPPDEYRLSLQNVQEVWTCSAYSAASLGRAHSRVRCIPHIIDYRRRASFTELRYMQHLVDFDPKCFYLLNVGCSLGYRKNTAALLDVFRSFSQTRAGTRLIVKCHPADPFVPPSNGHVISIRKMLSDGEIAALYSLADAYVSLHHSEGWGLALSDACSQGLPVMATGYSGNLMFMEDENSFLIPYREDFIHPDETAGLFTTSMKWAYPDANAATSMLQSIYDQRYTTSMREISRRAHESTKRFSPERVRPLLYEAINQVVGEL
jgi:glycosyltransferase involved in cell wall biosynthesis